MTAFIPYGRQLIEDDDIEAVLETLRSDFITQGPRVTEFEEALSAYCGAKYAVVFNSGTSALHAAYFAAGLSAGDEFITSPVTFSATATAGVLTGANVVFAPVEPDTGNLDVTKLYGHITPKTKLIVPVHFAGHPVDSEALFDVVKGGPIVIVEDACHALGTLYKDRVGTNWQKVGALNHSHMCAFSFHPVKAITTGEGGAVTTNDLSYYKKLKLFGNHGITKHACDFVNPEPALWYYEMQTPGLNYRMTDIQAALGVSQLRKLDAFIERRRSIAKTYNSAFAGNQYFYLPPERDYAKSSYHLYHIRLKDEYVQRKLDIFNKLKECGLGVQCHYIPVYRHPYYSALQYKSIESAEDFYSREISIPMYPAMTDSDVQVVIEKVLETFEGI
ncbi:MAG: UDP-4-amino-4,6-dideoxy-N-acetyl-beta-L-altrosamine transaminase [Nitrospirae bacterium]|nr:UDP-4-amino-4,6-dideoxy-N-acetyl-beta-L-altrosamine transaminase [Nitrospirota bacterium]MBF0533380.1 UDP-4-amino-4,6-dideoxy-N-acetyl-beta-L-altrosamine transaminase [Nitrospirota bacterium]MBF0616094.1 UDP-4-amino-4,6-dideoxy-N-acetyl-beta-L-altrosamine transaminase [Nitrospirota bacterium]